jgi:hypothetical protein
MVPSCLFPQCSRLGFGSQPPSDTLVVVGVALAVHVGFDSGQRGMWDRGWSSYIYLQLSSLVYIQL